MSKDFVFGPAMVRSYELEQRAVFPRIVIDHNLIRKLTDENREAFEYIIGHGDDGMFFIDYLNAVIRNNKSFTPTGLHENKHILIQHKEVAEKTLNELADKKESLRQKSLWLAKYHNSVVRRIHGTTDDAIPYLIPDQKLM